MILMQKPGGDEAIVFVFGFRDVGIQNKPSHYIRLIEGVHAYQYRDADQNICYHASVWRKCNDTKISASLLKGGRKDAYSKDFLRKFDMSSIASSYVEYVFTLKSLSIRGKVSFSPDLLSMVSKTQYPFGKGIWKTRWKIPSILRTSISILKSLNAMDAICAQISTVKEKLNTILVYRFDNGF
jgi:hypothetical protein